MTRDKREKGQAINMVVALRSERSSAILGLGGNCPNNAIPIELWIGGGEDSCEADRGAGTGSAVSFEILKKKKKKRKGKAAAKWSRYGKGVFVVGCCAEGTTDDWGQTANFRGGGGRSHISRTGVGAGNSRICFSELRRT